MWSVKTASRKAPRLDVRPTFLLIYNPNFITFPLALSAHRRIFRTNRDRNRTKVTFETAGKPREGSSRAFYRLATAARLPAEAPPDGDRVPGETALFRTMFMS